MRCQCFSEGVLVQCRIAHRGFLSGFKLGYVSHIALMEWAYSMFKHVKTV